MVVTRDIFAANAFRTLGLPASASQQAIEQSVRRMRLRSDPSRIPPTPFDLPWLGPLPRTRNDLEQAMAKLNEPATRLQERVRWIDVQHPVLSATTAEEVDARLNESTAGDLNYAHDLALLSLLVALTIDPRLNDAGRWQRLFAKFHALAASGDVPQRLADAERDGDFEKPADDSEIRFAAGGLSQLLGDVLTTRASAALADSDTACCLRVEDIVGGEAELGPSARRCSNRIQDQLEDYLGRRVEELRKYFATHVRCDRVRFAQNKFHNQTAAIAGVKLFRTTIEPLLNELLGRCPGNADRSQRLSMAGAKALCLLAVTWIWAGEFSVADDAFGQALNLAAGTPMEPAIIADRRENAPRAEHLRQQRSMAASSVVGAKHSSFVQTNARPRAKKNRAVWVSVFAIGFIIQMINMATHSTSTLPSSNTYDPGMSLNYVNPYHRSWTPSQPPSVRSLPTASYYPYPKVGSPLAPPPYRPDTFQPRSFQFPDMPAIPTPPPTPVLGGGIPPFITPQYGVGSPSQSSPHR